MQLQLHKVIIRVFSTPGHRNNLLIAIGRNSYPLGVLPSHFHVIVDNFSRHFHVLQCLMGGINHRNPKIIRIQLYVHRFHSFFCKIIRSIGSQIPVVYLPAHIGPARINLPNHHTGSNIPHPVISRFKHSTITIGIQELGIVGIFFCRLRITEHRTNGIVIRAIAIITYIPSTMFSPNAIQWENRAVYISRTLRGRNKFPEAVVRRHGRHPQFIAEHLQMDLTHFIKEVGRRRPIIVGRTVIRRTCW